MSGSRNSEIRMESKQFIRKPKDYNIGLAILRIWMCFMVVMTHCYDSGGGVLVEYLARWRMYHVPCFVLLSFYFNADSFGVFANVKKRLKKLAVPLVFWSFVYWVCWILKGNRGGVWSITPLLWKIAVGFSSEVKGNQLWYQTDIIILTLLVFVLFRTLGTETSVFALAVISVGALYLQYSGINIFIWSLLRDELKYTGGRLFEIFPYMLAGLLIQLCHIDRFVRKYRNSCLFLLLMLYLFTTRFNVFSEIDGFGYQGIGRIVVSTIIFLLFYLAPLQKVPECIRQAVMYMSKYTLGIYCSHMLVQYFIEDNLSVYHTWQNAVFVFWVSFGLSVLISCVPIKIIKNTVC